MREAARSVRGQRREGRELRLDGAWLFFDFATGEYLPSASVWTGAPPTENSRFQAVPVPLDYDGDGRTDFSVYSTPAWHFYRHDGSYRQGIYVGTPGLPPHGGFIDLPVPGDYDADGREDVVLFRDGEWLFYDFDAGPQAPRRVPTGWPTHWTGGQSLPAPLDYDGNGALDLTIYSGGPWHFYNADGSYLKGIWTGGSPGDVPLSRRLPHSTVAPP